MRRSVFTAFAIAALAATVAHAQGRLSLPPDGENQKSAVTQYIGLVRVTIEYNSPDVHAPNGEDRRGKIWGQLVPYGMIDDPFGTCTQCPWRAGSNENTVFDVSHDVKIEGQPLPAGRYGLFAIVQPDEWTLIFSKNATSWGSFFYKPEEDALRVKVKPSKSDYHEWLSYEFTDRKPSTATAALKWEDIQVPFKITVDDIAALHLAQIRNELRNAIGFDSAAWANAAQYALQEKHPQDALEFAEYAVRGPFIGRESFRTLSMLARAQEATGKTAEAKATFDKAIAHPTATPVDIHQYGRQLLNAGKKQEALAVFELNAKRHPNVWPVNVGLARGYSAVGRYKDALKAAKAAVEQAPDEVNKKTMQDAIVKLEAGKDINS